MGAKQLGYELLDRTAAKIEIMNNVKGVRETYEALVEFPFDSTRKRMSLIVRYGGKYTLMCKGADSIILPRVTFATAEDKEHEMKIKADLLAFAIDGLRTLCMASRELTDKEY